MKKQLFDAALGCYNFGLGSYSCCLAVISITNDDIHTKIKNKQHSSIGQEIQVNT